MLSLIDLPVLPLLSRLLYLILPFGQGGTKVLLSLRLLLDKAVVAILHGDIDLLSTPLNEELLLRLLDFAPEQTDGPVWLIFLRLGCNQRLFLVLFNALVELVGILVG